ncbi:cell filamentation protein Fic [Hoylesella timonensis]|uniref:Fic/DOC family protein n=2 Tax=Prevotellaceae TaxID=171552 RepID=A0A2U0TXX0_9BACT|nr:MULTISPECIES: Fic family protein [Prevotellaceae]PNP94071.1 cell filamentation protein Fic [Hoylesella timonensis]PVX48447.1 Fic/DOC family protein [Hallella colorans]
MNKQEILDTLEEYKRLGFQEQIDYEKFYLYSIITHSTAIEGSTMTEIENQLLFDEGLSAKGKSIEEQNMNLDLKAAYERSMDMVRKHTPFSIDMLKELSSIVMRRTGTAYSTLGGTFDSSKGDLRLVNVTAGAGGKSYMNHLKVPQRLKDFCEEMNERREQLLKNPDIYEQYQLSFDAHLKLVTIHPWVDGNGRMSRLIMNHIQNEFGLVPSKVLKEDKAEYIEALVESREKDSCLPFQDFMFKEHARNLQQEIDNYKLSMEEEEGEEEQKPRRHFRR